MINAVAPAHESGEALAYTPKKRHVDPLQLMIFPYCRSPGNKEYSVDLWTKIEAIMAKMGYSDLLARQKSQFGPDPVGVKGQKPHQHEIV